MPFYRPVTQLLSLTKKSYIQEELVPIKNNNKKKANSKTICKIFFIKCHSVQVQQALFL